MAVWDEEWSYDGRGSSLTANGAEWAHVHATREDADRFHAESADHSLGAQLRHQNERTLARARLAAAAPALVRALLAVEHGGRDSTCPVCGALTGFTVRGGDYVTGDGWSRRYHPHADGCSLDAALTSAGLLPEERDGARAALEKAGVRR